MLRLYENGKTLKELRQESGLKLYRVAELMNVSISRVKDIEKADNLTYRVITEYLSAIGYLIKTDSLTADFLAKKGGIKNGRFKLCRIKSIKKAD